jgi:hypothetical protein
MKTEKRKEARKGLTTAIKSKCVNIVVEEGIDGGGVSACYVGYPVLRKRNVSRQVGDDACIFHPAIP